MRTSTDWSGTASDPSRAAAHDRVERAVRDAEALLADLLPPGTDTAADLRGAGELARLVGAATGPADAARAAVATLRAEVVVGMLARGRPPARELHLVERSAERVGTDPQSLSIEVAGRAIMDARVLAVPTPAALRAVLGIVVTLAPVEHVSVWRRGEAGRLECLRHVGPGCPSRSVRDAARLALSGALGGKSRGFLQVVPVPCGRSAVLVARPHAGARERSLAFLRPAATALGVTLDRAYRLPPELPTAQLLANASERRVARIGFDLHDGPIQTLAALMGQTRRMQTETARTLSGDPRRNAVIHDIDDLKRRIASLELELRTLCRGLESPTVLHEPFERVVEREIRCLERQTGAHSAVELSGPFEELTRSQRIALLRVVQEALRNVREHSSAGSVAVQIRARPDGTSAVVENDGPGFDVEAAFRKAIRDGRVGLIGMIERIRLLGGTCEIRSRAEGPTTVSVSLPRWSGSSADEPPRSAVFPQD
jgi:signal transduction histidine kinase